MGILHDRVKRCRKNVAAAKIEQRDRIADYFQAISECLRGTYDALSEGEYPHQRCAEMETYATLLPHTLKGTIDEAKAADLAHRLARSHEVELLHSQLSSDARLRAQLPEIAQAAGILAALGKSVRAGLEL